jgi:YesN/AraC family two-component response regulator
VSAASTFNFHPNYLGMFLKKKTGKSFKELILIQRMSQAAIFLVNSSAPIYEIASEVGYENLGFFYKKFKAFFGVTPQEFRMKHQSEV